MRTLVFVAEAIYVLGFFAALFVQTQPRSGLKLEFSKSGPDGERVAVVGNEKLALQAALSALWPLTVPYLLLKFPPPGRGGGEGGEGGGGPAGGVA